MPWNEAVRIIATAERTSDLVAEGFAIGVAESSVLTRLGTFMWDMANDVVTAETLYRSALAANRGDPIALTNLARLLIDLGDRPTTEARRLLQVARSRSDRRFTWWRTVEAALDRAEGRTSAKAPKRYVPFGDTPPRLNRKQLRQRFDALDNDTAVDVQQRGYELERLLLAAAELSGVSSAGPYRIKVAAPAEPSLDGYLELGPDRYRLLCRWRHAPADSHFVNEMVAKLDVPTTRGLLISMSGFDAGAVRTATDLRRQRCVLLVDGDEVRTIIRGEGQLDEMLSFKRQYFDRSSEVYRRWMPGRAT
jgi:hypothetical protein